MKGEEGLRLVTLHSHPEYMEDCVKILNDQWPRSKTLRMRTLKSSCEEFPTNLVLLRTTPQGSAEVVGHSRMTIVPREPDAAWVESVIIRQNLRGSGYGRILMNKTEEYARGCGFSIMYLSTHDQQVFYGKLGYDFCPPVTIYGGAINKHLIPKQFIVPQITKSVETLSLNGSESHVKDSASSSSSSSPASPSTAPPPPPAPKKLTKNHITKLDSSSMEKMYMKKQL
ncbi:N-alpha-acetyltransferase 80-like [Eriocheir sinensis]|uniref:N-alpha-acetyltransferase 80-like n=1 Tax=Eriocheir sinensis TaxID=95602 RepID=UPI0021C80549|nr:N-alpha-acetyltransferase 80-like [Eriocheir sinensis]XP_050688162.1 N-alpha-acetyltransferase 80-like [Eriocheir sinensis]XP_050688163.1 N-alpha-acetyltransferase 80-like [Eriocheir sinensis]XP_050688164.1 N-alpha-acetyltransferase 80-like [Eriocheir sinensis]XP_050706859.1 N-alpha-acetyltransferase 80-like [Eriocheir sinensis]XP_050706860.1 N-alpha-acetyltransferase 80-like [Eriocheir sinensis]XP_050706861.1 N-alpha-acetyltransferase 80-like [Eriocheir sinensis]XP_050706862.1 N-alpha-ac